MNIYDLYDDDGELKNKVIERFMDEWKKRKALASLCEWWDSIPILFEITVVVMSRWSFSTDHIALFIPINFG